MFKNRIHFCLSGLLLLGSLPSITLAQTLPPIVIRDKSMVHGALNEVDAALTAALQKGTRDALAQAIGQFNEVISALADLDYTGLQAELKVTRKLYHDALGKLLNVLTSSCERGDLPDGMSAADLLRVIDPATAKGIGAARMQDIDRRLPACLELTLRIDSGIGESNLKYFVHVEVVVPLQYDLKGGYYRGKGQVTVLDQHATPPNACLARFNNRPADFTVNRLDLKRQDDTHLGEVTLSDYVVGQLDNGATVQCAAPSPPIPVRSLNWTTLFQMARFEQGNMQVKDWRMAYPQNVVASKQYSGPFGQYFSEATDLILQRSSKKR
ncbi:hypothetical protein MF271_22930 (plasmid) [Deinococcus sp. KNUC1210]|uniref:hypothetical protein n=1 Tax=Deinococcus sp. KNUC1210 TaxID=2917691 RepID=UPI001EEF85FB|nr:hypothetical protein [Deinococcus sp. KNUC1210]ULH18317.1 hypothetical protein MF271_22930 [Deinococcus sp. KNUC1210]